MMEKMAIYERPWNYGPSDYSRILPRLYVGRAPLPGIAVAPGIRTVVLCAREIQPPDEVIWKSYPGVHIIRCPLRDIERDFTPAEARLVAVTVRLIKKDIDQGRVVLVTCAQGLNRSPLLAAIAIKQYYGLGPLQTVSLIRQKRDPECLFNRRFLAYAMRQTVRLP
jgi:hypothetical protein